MVKTQKKHLQKIVPFGTEDAVYPIVGIEIGSDRSANQTSPK